jgi:hypothetical protein
MEHDGRNEMRSPAPGEPTLGPRPSVESLDATPAPADSASVSTFLPTVGQLARVVAGRINLIAVVDELDGGAIVLDVYGVKLPAGPARLSFNSSFGGVLLAGVLRVDERGTRFWPDAKGTRFGHRRDTFRVTVALRAMVERAQRTPLQCRTLNLSIGGALLECERPFAPAGELTLAIDYGDAQPMRVSATVIRNEDAALRLAVAFTNIDGSDERKLSLLVAAAQRRALASR